MKTAVIIGATSGIGRALAKEFVKNGYRVVITGRREMLLREIEKEINGEENGGICTGYKMDVKDTESARMCFAQILKDTGDVDVVVISAGTGFINFELDWTLDKEVIETNVLGFAALAGMTFNYFRQRGTGHFVGISSIAALRGTPHTVVYSGTKSFESVYMEGLRALAAKEKKQITVTDIRPGFVDTAMAKGKVVMLVPVEKAARQIMTAVRHKRKTVYVSKRWNLIAFLWHILPDWIYHKMI